MIATVEDSSPVPPVVERGGLRIPRWLGEICLGLILFVSFISFPRPSSTDPVGSWHQAMGAVAAGELQLGRDILLDRGPLGIWFSPTDTGDFGHQHWWWQITQSALFAFGVWWFSRRWSEFKRGACIAFFILIAAPYPEFLTVVMLMLAVDAYCRRGLAQSPAWSVVTGIGLGVVALGKFTHLLFAVGWLGWVLLLGWRSPHRRNTVILASSTLVTFLAGWIICGQALAALPAYIAGAWDLRQNSNQVAAEPIAPALLGIGLTLALLMSATVVRSVVGHRDRLQAAALGGAACGMGFLIWKQGLLQADTPLLDHFMFQLGLCVILSGSVYTWMSDVPANQWWRRAPAIGALLAAIGMFMSSPAGSSQLLLRWNARVIPTKDRLTTRGRWPGEYDGLYEHAKEAYSLPEIPPIVGPAAIDVLGNETAYARLNRLHWTPRPVFQSYRATTRDLAIRNAEWYQTNPPEFVLQKLQTIGDRLPALNDALAAREVYQHYRLIGQFRRFLVWTQAADTTTTPAHPELLEEKTVTWGQEIAVPAASPLQPIWCEIDLPATWWGRLRSTVLPPTALYVQTTDSTGFQMRYRYLPDAGRAGFLVSPHLLSNFDLLNFQTEAAPLRLTKFTLTGPDDDAPAGFPSTFTVRFHRLPAFTRNPDISNLASDTLFRSFSQAPSRYEAFYQLAELMEHDQPVVAVHPPSMLEFRVTSGAGRLTGRYGFFESALNATEGSDGVAFRIQWIGPDGRSATLMEQFLEPVTDAAHRAAQSFDIALPAGPGLVRLFTDPGPTFDLAFDWVYWQEIAFIEPAVP